jgi:hypothetical protein
MGEAPLGWSDLRAYIELTELDLAPWEARALRDLSLAYMSARERGKDVLSIPPSREDAA